MDSVPLTKKQADYILRRRVQQTRGWWAWLPKWIVSWLRWFGVAVIFKEVSQHAWEEGPKLYTKIRIEE